MSLTIGQQMALAVLRGDDLAAYALADKLLEERSSSFELEDRKDKAERESTHKAHDGYSVYFWPEFRAFMKRLGVRWNLDTIGLSIRLNEGEMVKVEQTYAGRDTKSPKFQNSAGEVLYPKPEVSIDVESFMRE